MSDSEDNVNMGNVNQIPEEEDEDGKEPEDYELGDEIKSKKSKVTSENPNSSEIGSEVKSKKSKASPQSPEFPIYRNRQPSTFQNHIALFQLMKI